MALGAFIHMHTGILRHHLGFPRSAAGARQEALEDGRLHSLIIRRVGARRWLGARPRSRSPLAREVPSLEDAGGVPQDLLALFER